MFKVLQTYLLEITAFTSGAVVMVLELTGSRILAPVVGSSLAVWASLIGIILASLSLGYTLGGKLADKKPNLYILSIITLLSAVFLGLIPILGITFLQIFNALFHNIRTTAIVGTFSLFGIPSTLLGMVSPYIIRLKMESVKTSGKVSGNIYAISTIGSIVGTFSAGFFLISYFGSAQIFYILSGLMLVLTFCIFPKGIKKNVLLVLLLYVSVLPSYFLIKNAMSSKRIEFDTNYNHVVISDTYIPGIQDTLRTMQIGNESSSAMFLKSSDLVYPYTAYYRLGDVFVKNISKALMIGGAGYSYPKDFLAKHPNSFLDVVEIDKGVTSLAKKYFNLKNNPKLTIYHEDGRTYINNEPKVYDAIYNDAFASYYSLPFQLTTKEAIRHMYNMTSKNGLVITNVISSLQGEKSDFFTAEYATYASIFPYVYVFAVESPSVKNSPQNIMIVAAKNSLNINALSNTAYEGYKEHFVKDVSRKGQVLSDNFAPVEQYALELIN